MVFAHPVTKGYTSTTASAAGLILSIDFIQFRFASVASAAVVGRAPGSLED
jgi:hypothetical protein